MRNMATPITFTVSVDHLVEPIAEQAAGLVIDRLRAAEEAWLSVDEAAAHLACPRSRIYRLVSRARWGDQANPIPFEKDGARLLFKRSALNRWVARGGALT